MAQAYLIVFGNRQIRGQKVLEIFSKIKPGQEAEKDPDTQILEGTVIKLEAVKPLKQFLFLKPYQKAPRVIIIFEAQNLTSGAQKVLSSLLGEERGMFILTATNSEVLPSSITQKCQIINLPLEPEIRLEKDEKTFLLKKLKKLKVASFGKRLKEAEEITSREDAILFCQKILVVAREEFLLKVKGKSGHGQNLKLIKNIQKTLKMLEANVNWRLAVENLFLELPSTS